MRLIKIFYRIEDDIDYNCLDKCPFGQESKLTGNIIYCGSTACIECKNCIKSSDMPVWNISVERGLNFRQGYVICKKCYTKPSLKMILMGFIHKTKMLYDNFKNK